jgi:flagellar hook-associated protein 2
MTANSSNSKETGSLGGQSAALTLSFINEIKLKLGQGALVGSSTISLTTMGVDYTTDGTLKFNKTNYSSGIANGLLSSLSQGISVGGSVGTTNDMSKTIANALNPNGAIDIYVKAKNSDIETTKTRIGDLSTRLRLLETSYTRQYSTLNTLLYNLSQTSNQLNSSLTAVTNINSAK